MKKLILLTVLLVVFALAVAGCDVLSGIVGDGEHTHTGGEATCTSGPACTECGEVYGEPVAHSYAPATCTTPEKCTECGKTNGSANGHNWKEADCFAPKTCSVCGETEGSAKEHNWVEADCDTPKTCSACGETEGSAKEHNWVEADCDTPKTCSACGVTTGAAKGHSWGATYEYNDNAHWLSCSDCDAKSSVGTHVGGEATTTEKAVCEVCSATYGDYEYNITWKTEAVSPLNGSTFTLANERIYSWYKSYNYTTTDTDEHWLEKDIFYPECPVFEWSVGEDAFYYKLYISTNADMSDAQCYLTSGTSLAVDYLYADTVYYWFVDAVYGKYTVRSEVFHFATDATPRTVNIEGVSNARDLGGYITEDGMKIKQGMIYRSAKLDDITELGEYTLLYILGIKTDLDLRGYEEEAPIEELNYVPVACPWYSTGSNHIWMNDYNKQEFAKAIKVFADIDNYPIIFHCSLGRDRTGTLAMVLGGLLGLDENTLMMEYELSVFSYWGTNGGTKYNDGLRKNIHDTYLYIYNNYEGDSFSEKVESFLLEIGVTAGEIASIRSIMLEEVE